MEKDKDIKELALKAVVNMAKCDSIILTGSYALYKMGLTESSNDIDIVLVNPDKATKDLLLFWQNEFPAETKASKNTAVYAIFKLNGVKIDVFVVDKSNVQTIKTDSGYEIESVKSIVSAKKSYRRLKDYLQLKKIAESIFKQSELDDYLSKTPINIIINNKEAY